MFATHPTVDCEALLESRWAWKKNGELTLASPDNYGIVMISKINFSAAEDRLSALFAQCLRTQLTSPVASDRRRPRLWRGRARKRTTRGNGPGEVAPRLRSTNNQSEGGWGRDRSGEKGRRREWQMELRSRRQIAGERMGFEVDPNGKLLRTHGEKK
jgi:hypothetical protein